MNLSPLNPASGPKPESTALPARAAKAESPTRPPEDVPADLVRDGVQSRIPPSEPEPEFEVIDFEEEKAESVSAEISRYFAEAEESLVTDYAQTLIRALG